MKRRPLFVTLATVMCVVTVLTATIAGTVLWMQYRQDIDEELKSSRVVAELLNQLTQSPSLTQAQARQLLADHANDAALRHIRVIQAQGHVRVIASADSEREEAAGDLRVALLVIVAVAFTVGLSAIWLMQVIRRQMEQHKEAASQAVRKEFAHALHDDLGQTLTALQFDVACLQGMKPEQLVPVPVRDRLVAGVAEAMSRLRAILQFTNPDGFEDNARQAFERLLSKWQQRLGEVCQLRWQLNRVLDDLPADQQLALYRALQEGLNNILKHAQATDVAVSATLSQVDNKPWCLLTIRDNGHGGAQYHPPTSGQARRYGLSLMKQRIESLGGSFSVHSAPAQGTQLTIGFMTKGSRGDL